MFGIDRTPNTCEHGSMDVRAAAQDAFAQIGVEARVPVGAHAASADLTIDLDGTATGNRTEALITSWTRRQRNG